MVDIDVQNRISNLVRERQIQISELKIYFDKNNKKLYKDIVLLNLFFFDEIFSNKNDFRLRYLFKLTAELKIFIHFPTA
jgi:hypothetical protein